MKAKILDIAGKEKSNIDLPKCFEADIREDVVQKVIESKKTTQPYAPGPNAGNNASASGIINRRRHVWKSGYGRGASRVPRKVMTRKGSQFNWVGATSPNTRGGRRAHPPKVASMVGRLSINKKEKELALKSSISATAKKEIVEKRYATITDKHLRNLPMVVESKMATLKAKDLKNSVMNVLGKDLFAVVEKKKNVRAGKGTSRGRKYKSNLGLLIVTGNDEKIKSKSFEIVSVKKLGTNNLSNGGMGRVTIYTEEAIKNLGEKFK